MFGLTTGASTTDEFPVADDCFSVLGGGHTEFFLTSGAETDGLELYWETLEAGGGQTLVGLTVGEGAYFLGLYFIEFWAIASHAFLALLGLTMLGDST